MILYALLKKKKKNHVCLTWKPFQQQSPDTLNNRTSLQSSQKHVAPDYLKISTINTQKKDPGIVRNNWPARAKSCVIHTCPRKLNKTTKWHHALGLSPKAQPTNDHVPCLFSEQSCPFGNRKTPLVFTCLQCSQTTWTCHVPAWSLVAKCYVYV